MKSTSTKTAKALPDFSSLLEKTVEEARAILGPGWIIRVKIKDGHHRVVTMDARGDRVNVETINEKIVRILGVG